MKLPKILKREKEFFVRLTGKGKSLPLGTIKAKDHSELLAKLTDMIKDKPELSNYPYIRILDISSSQELKIENPFANIEDYQQERSTRSKTSLDIDDLLPAVEGILRFQAELFKTAMGESAKALAGAISETYKSMFSLITVNPATLQQQQQSDVVTERLRAIADILKSLPYYIENKDKIDAFVKEALKSVKETEVKK